MSRDYFQSLLTRYHEGKCSPEEEEIVDAWYGSLEINKELPDLNEEELNKVNERLWHVLNARIDSETVVEKRLKVRKLWIGYGLAASLTAILLVSVFLLRTTPSSPAFQKSVANVVSEHNESLTEDKLIVLMDGSQVTLRPGSSLSYPGSFAISSREVQLTGEAFFEVSRDAERPFLVFSDQLVTKVLGTSFIVRSGNDQNEVEVMTGKVLVSRNVNESLINGMVQRNEVVLTPNQKAVFDKQSKKIVADLVAKPAVLSLQAEQEKVEFKYDNARVSTVLKEMEAAYGIAIEPEDTGLFECAFTGDLTSQDLYTQLTILCKSVGVSYEVSGTKIIIKGDACK